MKDRLHRGFKVFYYKIVEDLVEIYDENDEMEFGFNMIKLLRSRVCRRLNRYLDS